jgi:hypothetical protein
VGHQLAPLTKLRYPLSRELAQTVDPDYLIFPLLLFPLLSFPFPPLTSFDLFLDNDRIEFVQTFSLKFRYC